MKGEEMKNGQTKIKTNKIIEIIVENTFRFSALASVIAVVLITAFIFTQGGPAIFEIGIKNFLLGKVWKPTSDYFGILPMIIGSLYVTAGAMLVGVPIGVLTAVCLAEFATDGAKSIIEPAIDLLAGIPSVIYGFFGLVVIVPAIDFVFGGGGNSLLAAILILGIMILPTIINISKGAIEAVTNEYRDGSYALGASQIETIVRVLLPAAKSGIITAVVLGIGRAIGETMAVILVAGNSVIIPTELTSRFRTLTANIALEMGYAYGLHQEALFASGVVLFIFIILLNLALNLIVNKKAGE